MTRSGGGLATLATLALLAAAVGPAQAQAARLEYAVKATFLYKLAAFVDWPASAFSEAASPLNVCVVGANPFGEQLEQVTAGQRIGGRSILVRRSNSVDRGATCHILYLGNTDATVTSRALQGLRGRPVLTVTDASFEDSSRGIIHFVLREGRVRFEIDPDAAARNGVTLSSKLISLAVTERARP
jgi:hypothetical protein